MPYGGSTMLSNFRPGPTRAVLDAMGIDPYPQPFTAHAFVGRVSKAYCGKGAVLYVDPQTDTLVAVATHCHRYDCPTCGPSRAAEARAIARSGRPERLLTLTLRRDIRAPVNRQIEFIFRSWAELVRRIKRHFSAFSYMKVLELTKAGTPHLHVLTRGDYIPIRWIRHQWQQITGAFIVYIQRIDRTSSGVHEVTKYLLKTAAQLAAIFPNIRIFTHSRDWVIDSDSEAPDPQHNLVSLGFFRLSPPALLDRCKAYGLDVDSDHESPGRWTISPTGTPDLDAIHMDLGSFARDVGLFATVAKWLFNPDREPVTDFATRLLFYRGDYRES